MPAIMPTALLQDIQGPYVWVLDKDGIASRRTIARGDLKGDWLVVEKGLKPGERIVTQGAHKVRKGMKVVEPKAK
jgi:multidrug efflux pump subunit AcrA (membrane-fusion protein)